MKPTLNRILGQVHESFMLAYLERLGDGACLTDRDRRILYWNPAAELITGYSCGEMVGRYCWESTQHPDPGAGCGLCQNRCFLARAMQGSCAVRSVLRLLHKGGRRLSIEMQVSPMEDRLGRTIGALQVFRDLSALSSAREQVAELEQRALLDPLTGYPNRKFLRIVLNTRMGEWRHQGWPFCALLLSVDGIDHLRKAAGQRRVDDILRRVGRVLSASVRSYDQFGRWEESVFLAVLANVDAGILTDLARKFGRLVEQAAILTYGRRQRATLSIGATMVRPGDTADSLIDRAERMLDRSRQMGRNSVTVWV